MFYRLMQTAEAFSEPNAQPSTNLWNLLQVLANLKKKK